MTRMILCGIGVTALIGFTACDPSKVEKDDVEVDDTATDDSEVPIFSVETGDFPAYVPMEEVEGITFQGTTVNALWGYSFATNGDDTCMGAPGHSGFAGATGCLNLSNHKPGDVLNEKNLNFLALGTEGMYAGLEVYVEGDKLLSSDQGYTTEHTYQAGQIWSLPLSQRGTINGSEKTQANLQGPGEEDWLTVRLVDGLTTVLGTSASATGYLCPTEYLTNGKYAGTTATLVNTLKCPSIVAPEYGEYGWPWYKVFQIPGGPLIVTDPLHDTDEGTNGGVIYAFDTSGTLIYTQSGQKDTELGMEGAITDDQNGDGVPDLILASSTRDFLVLVDGTTLVQLSPVITGPAYTDGSSQYHSWGISIDLVTVGETTLVAIGAMTAENEDGVASGVVHLYLLPDLLAGKPSFMVIGGKNKGDRFGRKVEFLPLSSPLDSYDDIRLAICGDGSFNGCIIMDLQAAIDRTNTEASTHGGGSTGLPPLEPPERLEWLFPTEPRPIDKTMSIGIRTAH